MNSAEYFIFKTGTHFKYLQTAYKLLIEAYNELQSKKYNIANCNENKIRNVLVRVAKKKKSELFFYWITEFPDIERNNRIDIELITPYSLKDDEKTIKIECKIVGENNYINRNGINSFVEGKYSSEMFLAGMIGFIKDGKIENKIENIKNRIKNHKEIKTTKNLTECTIDKKFKYSYFSQHKRTKPLSKIDLYHLFFDFTATSKITQKP